MELPLSKGELTTRQALADLVGYADETALQRGMVKPQSGPLTDHMFLFHDPDENPYGDVVEPDRIEYVGQGKEGEQRYSAQNQYLAEHLQRGLTVHFFVKEAPGTFRYEGEVVCEGYERVYRPDEERSVLRFSLVRVEEPSMRAEEPLSIYGTARNELLSSAPEPRLVDRPQRQSVVQRTIRDVAFRDVVLSAYKRTCAVCGPPLRRGPYVDLEAAHIVAVSEGGPDHRRNGLSLCHRHHWAFDHGIFTLTDDLRVENLMDHEDPHEEIVDGETILVPSDPLLTPYPEFLDLHRSKWT